MRPGQIILLAYGAVLVAGGVFGYFTAGSLASLASGTATGVVALAALWISFARKPLGYQLGAAVAFIVAGLMAWRYLETRKVMPAGMLVVLSVAVLVFLLLAIRLERPRGSK